MAQQIKDLAFSLQWFGSLLWYRFDSWPGNFHVPGTAKKKKKKKKKVLKNMKWFGSYTMLQSVFGRSEAFTSHSPHLALTFQSEPPPAHIAKNSDSLSDLVLRVKGT